MIDDTYRDCKYYDLCRKQPGVVCACQLSEQSHDLITDDIEAWSEFSDKHAGATEETLPTGAIND